MSQAFDPYYRCLGIPPHQQPPNHYRLLGLEIFESHPDVISDAADRQMAHVRTYQLGEYSECSQKLLNELAAAKVCLLIPYRKAAYDAELHAKLAGNSPPSSVTPIATGPTLSPNAVEEDLGLAPEAPPRASARSSVSGPSVKKSPRPVSPPPMPSFVASRSPDDSAPPPNPTNFKPPYVIEYRRKFVETLVKILLLIFLLVAGYLLFRDFALPWLKETFPAQGPSGKETSATLPAAKNNNLPPPPPPPQPINLELDGEKGKFPVLVKPVDNALDNGPALAGRKLSDDLQSALRKSAVRETESIGENVGETFVDKQEEGGLLVGLSLTSKPFGKRGEYRAVASIQPEFLTSRGFVMGNLHGTPQANSTHWLAKDGYAIGALKINYAAGKRNQEGKIIGLQVTFMRIEDTQLSPNDAYSSSPYPFDFSVPASATTLGGKGDLIVGLCGTSTTEDLHSLGLLYLKRRATFATEGEKPAGFR